MESSVQLEVLARLLQSKTAASAQAVERACREAIASLDKENDYVALEFALDVLLTVGYRHSDASVVALDRFMRSVESRQLTLSESAVATLFAMKRYQNPFRLMVKGIDVLVAMRYLQTKQGVSSLLWASGHCDESVRKAAIAGLGAVTNYDISVYYSEGMEVRRGIGAAPQSLVIEKLEQMGPELLVQVLPGVMTLLSGLLSPTMQSTTWSSSQVTFNRTFVPADRLVVDVRRRSISILESLYHAVADRPAKLSIISVLISATRSEAGADKPATSAMIVENTLQVLDFFAKIVGDAELDIVQRIEHDCYWIQFHSASTDVEASALRVKAVIDANAEYSIYKVLIGFEGVFGDWSKARGDESFEAGSQQQRIKHARGFVGGMADDGLELWKQRILRFSETESEDLATFPVFYEFLGEVAAAYPQFALNLIDGHSEQMSRFLIPLLRGSWDGPARSDVFPIIERWVAEASTGNTSYVNATARMFLSAKQVDVDLLNVLLNKGSELGAVHLVRQVLFVSVARSDDAELARALKSLFLRALECLTRLGDADWPRDIWHRDEIRRLMAVLSSEERKRVLVNLRSLSEISFDCEEVLAEIAEHDPPAVIDYLVDRMNRNDPTREMEKSAARVFEELPHSLHVLHKKLARHPKILVERVFSAFQVDPSLFEFRGAKLLQIVFPDFPEPFRENLMELISTGGTLELEFAARILRAYDGQMFLYGVAKEIIKRVGSSGDIASEITAALFATGVVTGLYGLSDAYEKKRLAMLTWIDDASEPVRLFAQSLIEELGAARDAEIKRADESMELRKFHYGDA